MRGTEKQEVLAPSLRRPNVLTLDPGFEWTGYGVIRILRPPRIVTMGLLWTQKSKKKLRVRQADDSFRRAGELAEALHELIVKYDVKALCIESFSPPRHASVTGKMGHVYGALACLAMIHDLPVIASTPQEVRRSVGASGHEKGEVRRVVRKRYKATSLKAFLRFEKRWSKNASNHRHAWDAVAVYESVRSSEVIRALRSR